MPGRPQRRPPSKRTERARPSHLPAKAPLRPVEVEAPPTPGPIGFVPGSPRSVELRGRLDGMAKLSTSYAQAMSVELTPSQGKSASRLQTAILKGAKERGRLTVADAVAACLFSRAVDRGDRSGVAAAKELADRTEGPVVQRSEVASVRYVVSLSPSKGAGGDDAPMTVAEWEALANDETKGPPALPAAPPADTGEVDG